MPFVAWPRDEKRREECCKGSNNDEYVREETPRQALTEVDGQSAGRYERSKACTEQRSLEKCRHGYRPQKRIRSAKVSKAIDEFDGTLGYHAKTINKNLCEIDDNQVKTSIL